MSRQDKLIVLLASWFGAGRLPLAPGTWGSLAVLPLWWLLQPLSILKYSLTIIVLIIGGIYLSGRAEALLKQHDAPVIVIDEVVGQLIALAGCPRNVFFMLMSLALFRLFDIVKPFPAGLINTRLTGGLGIMLDDVVAGLYAWLVLTALIRFMIP